MLTIRKEQMQAFEQAAMGRFEEEMAAHSREFSPRLCEVVGDDQVRLAVRDAIGRCRGHGFTSRGPIRLFIEMAFLFGRAFDTDPQYAWASRILRTKSDQMLRAERLYEGILAYQDKVPDPDPAVLHKALEGLSDRAGKFDAPTPTQFVEAMLREMARLAPEKAAHAGQDGLADLTLEGCAVASKNDLATPNGKALMGMLMFTFGHDFVGDPLHLWARKVLENNLPVDPAGRTMTLEKEACSFLRRMAGAPNEAKGP
jgi:hypothetical protein